jgi:SAM-dependent methyltransferase
MVSDEGWNHSRHYYPFILQQLPARMDAVLDVGCGTGGLTRLLAARARRVIGIDLSPEMVRMARLRSTDLSNIEFQVEDVNEWRFPPDAFDAIVSVATLHHLPAEHFLARAAKALRPGGVLVVNDALRMAGPKDWMLAAVAAPLSWGHRLRDGGRIRDPRRSREAWSRHNRLDRLPSFAEVRGLRRGALADAELRRHLFWRYSLVWRKPVGSASGEAR